MELLGDNVNDLLKVVLAESEDKENPDFVYVDGIVNNYLLDRAKLEEHREDIQSMIEQLPTEFLKDGGGGWSFLNLCMRADGVQWTGLHWVQEMLYAMAAGLGMAKFSLPREMWAALPGNVPYIVFDPTVEVEA